MAGGVICGFVGISGTFMGTRAAMVRPLRGRESPFYGNVDACNGDGAAVDSVHGDLVI